MKIIIITKEIILSILLEGDSPGGVGVVSISLGSLPKDQHALRHHHTLGREQCPPPPAAIPCPRHLPTLQRPLPRALVPFLRPQPALISRFFCSNHYPVFNPHFTDVATEALLGGGAKSLQPGR